MELKADLIRPNGGAVLVSTHADHMPEKRQMPCGWWILPFVGIGSFCWIAIFRLIF